MEVQLPVPPAVYIGIDISEHAAPTALQVRMNGTQRHGLAARARAARVEAGEMLLDA